MKKMISVAAALRKHIRYPFNDAGKSFNAFFTNLIVIR